MGLEKLFVALIQTAKIAREAVENHRVIGQDLRAAIAALGSRPFYSLPLVPESPAMRQHMSHSTMSIQEYEQRLLGLIDAQVEKATDDELFAGGYLRGHISLATAYAELEGRTLIHDVKSNVLRSLNEAILRGELSEEDQALVLAQWQLLKEQAES